MIIPYLCCKTPRLYREEVVKAICLKTFTSRMVVEIGLELGIKISGSCTACLL